mgnify:CR=1 FL=1
MGQIKVTWKRSAIGFAKDQKETLRAHGLRRLNQTVVKEDNPSIRGMLRKVEHLVHVEEA